MPIETAVPTETATEVAVPSETAIETVTETPRPKREPTATAADPAATTPENPSATSSTTEDDDEAEADFQAADAPSIVDGLIFPPVADARVDENVPTRNLGSSSRLRADASDGDSAESYLTFDVSGVTGNVSAVTLRLFVVSGSADGPAVYSASSDWTEAGITWSNRPGRDTNPLADVGRAEDGEWIEYDLTGVVTADGTYTFVLATDSADGTSFSSGERPRTAPQLVVTIDDASTATSEAETPVPPTSTTTASPSPTVSRTATSTRAPVTTSTPTSTPRSTATATPPPDARATATRLPTRTPVPEGGETAVVLAAGDIASCTSTGDEATGKLVADEPGTVLTLGDLAYDKGTAREFADCYDPSWGGVKDRTKPVPGNHEYNTADAAGYYDYFGAAAGNPATGYYSYDLGEWHVIALNSNCSHIGGCGVGSAQERWLRADLAANPTSCTLAYWHHPLFSSGRHGNDPRMSDLWQALDDADAELVLVGHDHIYERFAPQDANGRADPDGVREFIVGSGGRNHYSLGSTRPNSEIRNSDTYGVLRIELRPTSYAWTFLPVAGATFTDSGSAACHDADGPLARAQGSAGMHAVDTAADGTSADVTNAVVTGAGALVAPVRWPQGGAPVADAGTPVDRRGRSHDLHLPGAAPVLDAGRVQHRRLGRAG